MLIRSLCTQCHAEFSGEERFCPKDGTPLLEAHGQAPENAWPIGVPIAGRYVPRRLVGTGAMARVYLADDLAGDGPVALKLLGPELAGDPALRERFLHEARAALRIQHPCVVRLFDCGEADGVSYLTMEMLEGEPLGDFLRREGHMSWELAVATCRHVALALEATHAAGVVHRDVKPDNLFLVGEIGRPSGVKLVDFGLAAVRERRITAAGTAVGTAEYMAPEQVVADTTDTRTDLYGLGLVLYRALTGERPFDGERPEDYLAHHFASQAPPPSWIAEGLPPGLDEIVLTALRKHPDNRYQTARAIFEDLERIGRRREGARPRGVPLSVAPDRYLPRTELGRNVARVLVGRLGGPVDWLAR